MVDGSFPGVGFHVLGVHLSPHLEALEQIPEGDGIRKVQEQFRRRRRCGGNGREANKVFFHAGLERESAVDAMLNH